MGGAELVFIPGQNERPLDRVLKFANIARPQMLAQEGNRGHRDFLAGEARLACQAV